MSEAPDRSAAPRGDRRPRLLAVSVLALAAALVFAATPALAARGHVLDESLTIGEPGSGPGQLSEPAGLALNEATGVLYVVDKGNNRVQRFDAATGAYLGQFNGGPTYEPSPGLTEPTTEAGHGAIGFPEEVQSGVFEQPEGIAVDNDPSSPSFGDVYVTDDRESSGGSPPTDHAVVDKFSPAGAYLGQITRNVTGEDFSDRGFRNLYGVAVDPRGEVWVYHENFGDSPHLVANYSGAQPNVRIGSREVANGRFPRPQFAVDSTDHLYVGTDTSSSHAIYKFTSLGGHAADEQEVSEHEFGSPPASGVATEPTTDDVYVDNESTLRRYTPEEHQLEELPVPGGHGAGLAVDPGPPGAGAGPLYVADPSAGTVHVYPPEPPGPPTVEPGTTSVLDVTADSAGFEAVVNPRSESGEAPTAYRFEYGACPTIFTCPPTFEATVPVPDGSLEANYEPDPVSAAVTGLAPATAYHFRLSAENSLSGAPTLSEERVFTTQPLAATGLPDHRAYEMVSPPDKHGALIEPIATSSVQASASGDAFTAIANAPTESEPPGFASQRLQILFRRGPSSWESEDIGAPHEATVGFSQILEYPFFSEDLESAIVEPSGPFTRSISPQASERTPFLRTNFPAGAPSHPCDSGCYRPLVSGCPELGEPCPAPVQEVANVPAGTKFGAFRALEFRGAGPDARHVVFTSVPPLSEGAPPSEAPNWSLYEWSADTGALDLISVLPSGAPVPTASVPMLGYARYSANQIARHAISADGSRIVFSESAQTSAHHLYLRDTTAAGGEGQTIQLDLKQTGATGAGAIKPIFQDASEDGSRIFFTDTQQLLPGASTSGADLYECRVTEAEGEVACKLYDLTAQGTGEAADVIGLIAGASADGSSVYFTANGRLTEEPDAHGEEALAGDCQPDATGGTPETETAPERCNLYLRSGGQTRLIAVLSGADSPDWRLAPTYSPNQLAARPSPDGRYLAFMSQRPLTAYDNRDAATGRPAQEVFLYDAAAVGGQGSLLCASCNPTGARPHALEYRHLDVRNNGIAGGIRIWPKSAGIAATLPAGPNIGATDGISLYQPRYLSDSGRLFFNAADALVPADSNGTVDVYQYEPPAGAGEPASDTCATTSSTYVIASQGCVDLISSGDSKQESAFLDASESGDDVFFLTSAQLSNRDEDSARDVYDARVGGGEAEAVRPVECSGDACQQPAVPPNDATPGSLTFNGAGNVLECPKGKVKKSGKCAAAKKHKAKHKKKSHKRSAKSKQGSK